MPFVYSSLSVKKKLGFPFALPLLGVIKDIFIGYYT
jgi:hypothetical protein